MNDLLLRTIRGEPVPRPPVWMMRQAGRYLPEYRAVRARHDFLTMVRTPELAAEVTIQPVQSVGVDAAIIFSDILVIPESLGLQLVIEEGSGPRFPEPLAGVGDRRLRPFDPSALTYVYEAIRLTVRELQGQVPVIGFAGGPWTLLAYMVEGGGSRQFARVRRLLAEDPASAVALLEMLADAVGTHLVEQAKAGASVVQLFESWAGAVAPAEYRRFVLPALARAAAHARGAGVPVIVFTPGAGALLGETMRVTGADVAGVDWQTEQPPLLKSPSGRPLCRQGNLDPSALYAPVAEIERRTEAMLRTFADAPHIANLGHGILPDTPPDHARAFVEAVKRTTRTPAAAGAPGR